MADASNHEKIEAYWRAVNTLDWAVLEQLSDAQYVWEMPQSGERIRGVATNREMYENYPGRPEIETQRITGSKDKWVTTPTYTVLKISGSGDEYTTESRVSYPDGSVWHAIDFFQFRNGKILRQVAYFAPTLEAAEWRARWVERF
jgi:ketosteroid isomerase-like protein